MIDGIATVITSIHGNVASGFILLKDFSLKKCYVVKQNNILAHGQTAKDAFIALEQKFLKGMSRQERIQAFIENHLSGIKYSGKDLFEWHGKLTGSCELGRIAFCRDHDIDLDTAEFTVSEFIDITKNNYNGGVIIDLENAISDFDK